MPPPRLGRTAFHSQQCAEKYLKALVQQSGAEPPRTHHLPTLLDMLTGVHADLEDLRLPCESLAPYAVHFRYPGEEASEGDAVAALGHAEVIRSAIRQALGLPSEPSEDADATTAPP